MKEITIEQICEVMNIPEPPYDKETQKVHIIGFVDGIVKSRREYYYVSLEDIWKEDPHIGTARVGNRFYISIEGLPAPAKPTTRSEMFSEDHTKLVFLCTRSGLVEQGLYRANPFSKCEFLWPFPLSEWIYKGYRWSNHPDTKFEDANEFVVEGGPNE